MKYSVNTISGIFVTEYEATSLEHAVLLAEEDGYEVLDGYDDPTFRVVVAG